MTVTPPNGFVAIPRPILVDDTTHGALDFRRLRCLRREFPGPPALTKAQASIRSIEGCQAFCASPWPIWDTNSGPSFSSGRNCKRRGRGNDKRVDLTESPLQHGIGLIVSWSATWLVAWLPRLIKAWP